MPINSHNSPEVRQNKLNAENLGIDSTISMRNSNGIRPHGDPERRAGLREGNPHPLFYKFLQNHFNMHKKRRIEDLEKYSNRISNV